jgi:hypothetical protein
VTGCGTVPVTAGRIMIITGMMAFKIMCRRAVRVTEMRLGGHGAGAGLPIYQASGGLSRRLADSLDSPASHGIA